jgi:hypothetical protein
VLEQLRRGGLDKWEDFGKHLGLKEDMDIFAYMKETKYKETD